MNQELSFETIPFELDPEIQGEIFEEESEFGRRRSFGGGGSRSFRPRSQPGLRSKGTKRPPIPRPRPIPRGPRRPWEVIREPYGLVSEPYSGEPEPSGAERVRWLQDCLNQSLGLQLSVTGVMGPETRSAVRSFQRRQGLRASGIVGPDTEEALIRACRPNAAAAAARGEEPTDDALQENEWSYEAEPEFGSFGETEVAAAMKGALAQLPAQQRPKYKSVGRLVDAINTVSGPGLYLITFTVNGKEKAYSGKANDLKQRLMQHRLCAQMLGLPVENHMVQVAPLATITKSALRKTEKAINTYVLNKHKDLFTNTRKELEEALMGESWN